MPVPARRVMRDGGARRPGGTTSQRIRDERAFRIAADLVVV